jgi:hypothetical protein
MIVLEDSPAGGEAPGTGADGPETAADPVVDAEAPAEVAVDAERPGVPSAGEPA